MKLDDRKLGHRGDGLGVVDLQIWLVLAIDQDGLGLARKSHGMTLKECLARYALGRSQKRAWAAANVIDHPRRDIDEIGRKGSLVEWGVRPEDPIGMGEFGCSGGWPELPPLERAANFATRVFDPRPRPVLPGDPRS